MNEADLQTFVVLLVHCTQPLVQRGPFVSLEGAKVPHQNEVDRHFFRCAISRGPSCQSRAPVWSGLLSQLTRIASRPRSPCLPEGEAIRVSSGRDPNRRDQGP